MKKLYTTIAAIAFAGSANAFEGSCFEKNNPDLYSGYNKTASITAKKPVVGDSVHRSYSGSVQSATSYDAWVQGNPDQASGS